MKKLYLLSFIALLGAVGCSQEDMPSSDDNVYNANEIFHLDITYHGTEYNDVECVMDADSLRVIDPTFREIYQNEIVTNPNLATVLTTVDGECKVSYFKDEPTLIKECGFNFLEPQSMKGSRTQQGNPYGIIARAILHDDRGYRDRQLELKMEGFNPVEKSSLKGDNFNDKTSSIKVYNYINPDTIYHWNNVTYNGWEILPCLITYENTNFSGKVVYCVGSVYNGTYDHPNGTEPHSDYNLDHLKWSDKISSCIFKVINKEQLYNGSYRPHDPI